jgi:hypothetical protein
MGLIKDINHSKENELKGILNYNIGLFLISC